MTEFKVISSDSHIIEPPDLWTTRIEAKYRDRAPYIRRGEDADNWYIEGDVDLGSLGTTVGAGQRYIDPSKMTTKAKIEQIPRGAYDPEAHIQDMHLDGVDAGVIYPSLGLRVFRVPDSGLLSAIMRTYNDWLSEFCGAYPDRLKGIAMVNVDDVQEGVEELKRTRKLGLAGAMISVFPQEGRSYKHTNYEPLWAHGPGPGYSFEPPYRHQPTGWRSGSWRLYPAPARDPGFPREQGQYRVASTAVTSGVGLLGSF